MIKTRTWIIITICLIAVLTVSSVYAMSHQRISGVVQIIQDGVVIEEIDLSAVTEKYSFTVYYEDGGSNVITVEPGRIRVSDADCPDRICVRMGWLYDQAAPVVCMPHRLVISLKEADTDAVSR